MFPAETLYESTTSLCHNVGFIVLSREQRGLIFKFLESHFLKGAELVVTEYSVELQSGLQLHILLSTSCTKSRNILKYVLAKIHLHFIKKLLCFPRVTNSSNLIWVLGQIPWNTTYFLLGSLYFTSRLSACWSVVTMKPAISRKCSLPGCRVTLLSLTTGNSADCPTNT